jgi:peptidoglycan/LPS O-acetylase OafA/YrhL
MTIEANNAPGELASTHLNSFDALRLIAAYSVLFAHHFDLTKTAGPTIAGIGFGSLGVAVFFAISGYLVAGSYFADPSFGRFLMRRMLRIFPGLAACVLFTVFIAGTFLTTLDTSAYLTDERTWTYLKTLVLKIKYELPGVFEQNPHPNTVNGSLWTIPLEFKCYLLLAALSWVFKTHRSRFLLFAALGSAAYYLYRLIVKQQEIPFHALYPLAFFVGVSYRSALYERFNESVVGFSVLILVVFTFAVFPLVRQLAVMCLVALIVLFLGTKSIFRVPDFFRRNDISYGVYLYAFVVQQAIYCTRVHETHFWWTLLLVTIATSFCALLSCWFVEQPMLKMKPKRLAAPL